VSHRNARLNVRGRLLLVERALLGLGRPVAHVAKELGVLRQCAHRWIRRFHTEGASGLHDRPCRPRRSPTRTPADVEPQVLQARREQRRGPDWIGARTWLMQSPQNYSRQHIPVPGWRSTRRLLQYSSAQPPDPFPHHFAALRKFDQANL
jgi:transposase-like protein